MLFDYHNNYFHDLRFRIHAIRDCINIVHLALGLLLEGWLEFTSVCWFVCLRFSSAV